MVRRVVVVAFVLAFLAVGPLSAQEEPERYVEEVTFHVRLGAAAQFEDYIKKVVEGATKVGIDQAWSMFQARLGARGATYVAALPFENWGEMDSWTAIGEFMKEAFDEKEAVQIIKTGTAAIESYQTRVFMLRKDLTTKVEEYMKGETPHKYLMMTEMKVKREKEPDFLLLLKKTKAAEDKDEGRPMAGRWQCVLGPLSAFMTVRPFDRWGDEWSSQDKAMREMFGDAEAEQLSEIDRSAIESMDMYVLEYRPGLSRIKEAPATEN